MPSIRASQTSQRSFLKHNDFTLLNPGFPQLTRFSLHFCRKHFEKHGSNQIELAFRRLVLMTWLLFTSTYIRLGTSFSKNHGDCSLIFKVLLIHMKTHPSVVGKTLFKQTTYFLKSISSSSADPV